MPNHVFRDASLAMYARADHPVQQVVSELFEIQWRWGDAVVDAARR